jgi:hypothetical protein
MKKPIKIALAVLAGGIISLLLFLTFASPLMFLTWMVFK